MIYCSFQNVSYALPNGRTLFENITFTLNKGKFFALAGKNGMGKSTLFRLLAKEIGPTSGQIIRNGTVYLQEQETQNYQTVAHSLGLAEPLALLAKMEAGYASAADIETLHGNWDVEEKGRAILAAFALDYLTFTTPHPPLSGGEKARLSLARAFLSQADILLLDEPTNNVDAATKQIVLEQCKSYPHVLFLITHDRDILEHVEGIYELSHIGIQFFPGNIDAYFAAKDHAAALLHKKEDELEKDIEVTRSLVQITQTQFAVKAKMGIKKKEQRRLLPGAAGAYKNAAEAHQSVTARVIRRKKEEIEEKQQELTRLQERESFISLPKPVSIFPAGKRLFEMENVSFAYSPSRPLLSHVSMRVSGSERVALTGKSGCGKSTFIRLLLGQLQPQQGRIRTFVPLPLLDQNLSIIPAQGTVWEAFRALHTTVPIQEARYALGRFRFRNDTIDKNVGILSGGERVKLALACLLGQELPPILLLDEPTNNLDFESIEILEDALRSYTGALFVISHDSRFLDALDIERRYVLEEGKIS